MYIYSYINKIQIKNIMSMEVLFFISVFCFLISAFEIGFSHSFKEMYKRYYKVIFTRNGIDKPYLWPYSRQRNHNKYIAFIWLTAVFGIATIACGIATKLWWFLIFAIILAPVLTIIGELTGKKICRSRIKRQCKEFKLTMQEVD